MVPINPTSKSGRDSVTNSRNTTLSEEPKPFLGNSSAAMSGNLAKTRRHSTAMSWDLSSASNFRVSSCHGSIPLPWDDVTAGTSPLHKHKPDCSDSKPPSNSRTSPPSSEPPPFRSPATGATAPVSSPSSPLVETSTTSGTPIRESATNSTSSTSSTTASFAPPPPSTPSPAPTRRSTSPCATSSCPPSATPSPPLRPLPTVTPIGYSSWSKKPVTSPPRSIH